MSPLSWGLAQGLQRSMATRRRAFELGRSEGRSKERRLLPRGEPSGVSAAEQGMTARIRARPVKRESGLEYLGVGVRLDILADGRRKIVHPCPTTHSEVRCWAQRVGEGGVSAVNTRNGEGVVCANNVVRALLPVGGQVARGQVVAGQTLVSHDASAVESRQGKTWESAHVDLVGRQTRRRADGIVVSDFDVGQMQVPIVLSLVDDHSQHLGHSVVYPLNAPVTVEMMGACSKLAHAQQLMYS